MTRRTPRGRGRAFPGYLLLHPEAITTGDDEDEDDGDEE
jgi:hypothetical protein